MKKSVFNLKTAIYTAKKNRMLISRKKEKKINKGFIIYLLSLLALLFFREVHFFLSLIIFDVVVTSLCNILQAKI